MARHTNRYVHRFEKVFSKQDILDYFGEGWQELINDAYDMIGYIPNIEICSAVRCYGMLHMYIRSADDNEKNQDAAEGIAWKVERLSALTCEHCGSVGKRRTELKYIYCLCTDCYLHYLNSGDDPMSLFKQGQEGRFNNTQKTES